MPTFTADDVLLIDTLVRTVREHHAVHAADDPDALDELLWDADALVAKLRRSVPDPAAGRYCEHCPANEPCPWHADDIPL